MKSLKSIDVSASLASARKHLANNSAMDSATRNLFALLITIVELMVARFGANSKNSSVPPSQDPNAEKRKRASSARKPGGQAGRVGKTLVQSENPDEIVALKIDPEKLPSNVVFKELPYEKRQVFDIHIVVHVTEYQVQVLQDSKGRIFKADCPVQGAVQYGPFVRGLACYMSNYQLVPVERLVEFFGHQANLPISAGTISNINAEAASALEEFKEIAKANLVAEKVLHADETGLNVSGKGAWLHGATSLQWSLFCVSLKRGNEAMDSIGILPNFSGVLVHDHWASYFKYECTHAMCCAHLIRELTRVVEEDKCNWAKQIIDLLYAMKAEVEETKPNKLTQERIDELSQAYESIISAGEIESPIAVEEKKSKRGRKKQSRARNLLDRLREKKNATLRFMTHGDAPFTNNLAERDIRMTKVHQKISRCYKSLETANAACLVRSFISTCQKQGICVSTALNQLFLGKLPHFRGLSSPSP
jgi:transposase